MATVYERLLIYSKLTRFKFKFPQVHSNFIGAEIAKHYRANFGDTKDLPVVESVEEFDNTKFTFNVFSYPDHFTGIMDAIIVGYVKRITKPKNIIEKPIAENLSRTDPISSFSPPKKLRKRKPIQAQPQFSGKKLIKK